MLNAGNPIGVMDSGIGGLTVVRELQRILPGEDIIYFGDSANCPYGNKTSDQIFELSSHMLQFLGDNGVKCTAIACNTISTMADRLRPCFDYKIVSIVEEAAKYVLREHLKSVGLIATEFTVASGKYAELIHEGDPECKVVGKGSPLLAALVDRGDFNQHDINTEIRTQVDNILAREKVENLILGCTHYPIVEENFHECYPEMHLINPALEQANAVKAYLTEQNALNPQKKGKFVICTSGDPQVYVNVGKRSGAVIATGGGCVTREENYDLLHQNGIIFWLKRDIDQLPREGRPLSAGDLAAMYDRRKACYERFADHIVDNNGTVEDTVQAILDCLK